MARPKRGLGAIFLGPVGIGKTSMLLQAPKPLVCLSMVETGFFDFEAVGEIPPGCTNFDVTDYSSLLMLLRQVDCATIVLDSLTGFQQLLFDHIVKTIYGGDKKKFSAFSVGSRKDAPTYMPELFGLLESKLKKGMHIFITCHRTTESIEDPLNPDHISYGLNLDRGIRERWEAWAPNILMLTQHINIGAVTKESRSNAILEGKAIADDLRLLYTTASPSHPAKNKLKLPSYIPLGKSPQEAWKNFWDKVPEVFKEQPDAGQAQPG